MKRQKFILAVLLLLFCSQPNHYDIIIRNGSIVDGAGSPAYTADIGIRWDRIVAIGDLSSASAEKEIDSEGMYVVPGFIDIHSGGGIGLLADGRAVSKIQQGITTIIVGGDYSPAPAFGSASEKAERELNVYGLDYKWNTFKEYFDLLKTNGISVNVGSYVGAWQIRGSITTFTDRIPQYIELRKMNVLLKQSLQEGAFGMSMDMTGVAERYLNTGFLTGLATVMKNPENSGIIATRIRYEDERALVWLDEIEYLFADYTLPVEIMELKMTGEQTLEQVNALFDSIESIQSQGKDYGANIIPLPLYSGYLTDIIPMIFKRKGWEQLKTDLNNSTFLQELETELLKNVGGWQDYREDWSKIRLIDIHNPDNEQYIGKTLYEVIQSGPDPVRKIAEILLAEEIDVRTQIDEINENFVREALKRPWIKLSTGAPIIDSYSSGKSYSILDYAAFPGALAKYVRDEELLSIEEMIKKMTSLNAERLNLNDRGALKIGYKADITVIDIRSISSVTSTIVTDEFDTGVRYVIVNGDLVYRNGNPTGSKPGEVLYGKRKK